MPPFKTTRVQTLVGIAVVFFLCLGVAVPTIIHQELFSRYDGRAKDAQYGAVERVASDVYVNWDTRLVPETKILSHVPGFTIIRSLLVINDTFFVVSDRPNRLPELQFMLSVWSDTNGERPSTAIPTQEIRVISRKAARKLMETSASLVAGTTWIYNEPYVCVDGSWPLAFLRTHYMQYNHSTNNAALLPPRRLVFSQIHAEKRWHNSALWSLPRLLFPGLGVLYTEDLKDYTDSRRPFLFEYVVLIDRGAAARNPLVQGLSGDVALGGGKIDNETANLNLQLGTPFDSFRSIGGSWWNQWRHLLAENANLEADIEVNKTTKTVITLMQDYNGQGGRLAPEGDAQLRAELATMKLEEGYEVNYVKWNQTDFVGRLHIALRTTIFLGVAGSLTDATWMTVAPHSAVMEFFPDHYLSRRTQGIADAIGVHYTAWQGSKSYHFPSREPPSKTSGNQNDLHPFPDGQEARNFIEPREDDLIQIDGKAVADAIRKWVREHDPVDTSPS